MNGSGMIILNSPYGLFEDLQNVMEELLTHLRKDNDASIRLEYLNPPV
jgi:23S rRNA (adenine2030-N6)-methyltransferase